MEKFKKFKSNIQLELRFKTKVTLSVTKIFTKKQILSLIKLIKLLMKKYKIKKENILGHSDIAPLRKLDPGEKFPWNF